MKKNKHIKLILATDVITLEVLLNLAKKLNNNINLKFYFSKEFLLILNLLKYEYLQVHEKSRIQ